MSSSDFHCGYQCHGGMLGEQKSIALDKKGDGAPVLQYSVKEAFNLPERSGSVIVQEEAVFRLVSIFNDHNMGSWPPLRKMEERILDAPSESISISVDGRSCSFMFDDIMPDGCWGLMREITDILMGCVPKEPKE